MRLGIFFLLILPPVLSGNAQAVTRTVNTGGGTFNIEITDLPPQRLYAPVAGRPLQMLDEIRGTIHYSNQQPDSRISMGRNREVEEMDRLEIDITATPVSGILKKESETTVTPYSFFKILERGENAEILLTDNRKFICTGAGNETLRIRIELSGYQVTATPPAPGTGSYTTVAGNHFRQFNHVETIDLPLACVNPQNYSGAVTRAWRLQGEDVALWSEVEMTLIPPPPVRVGERINVIGLVKYKSQNAGTSIGFGSDLRASTIEEINFGGHVRPMGRSLNDSIVTPVTEYLFSGALRLNAVGDMQAIVAGSYACVRPGNGTLSWDTDATTVIAHDNATPNDRFEIPDVNHMSLQTRFECLFNPVNQVRKTLVVNGATLEVELNHQDRIIDDRQPHTISGTVTYRAQSPSTRLDALNTQNAINFENQPLALGASAPLQGSITCQNTLRNEHSVAVNIGLTRKTTDFPAGGSDSDVLAAPQLAVPIPVTCRNRDFWGRVEARSFNADIPLMNMKVQMTLDGRDYFTATDRGGYFDFFNARASQYGDNSQPALRLIFADGGGPNPQQFRLVDNASADTAFVETGAVPIANFPRYLFLGGGSNWPATNIPQAHDNSHDKLKNYGTVFALFSEATAFANRRLNVALADPAPVRPLTVSMYDTGITISHSDGANNRIRLEVPDSRPHDHWESASVMMHELGHMVMWHSRIGGPLTQPQPYHANQEFNHLGRANFSTTDSWVEGFASWFSAVILKQYRPPLLNSRPYVPGAYDFDGVSRLQQNDQHRVWDSLGRNEEWALAGVLWDVYDAPVFYNPRQDADGNNDEVTVPLWRLWPALHRPAIRNFKDVYDGLSSLAAHYTGWQAKLDQVFREHGFFADTDNDNSHDPGEEVGRSAWGRKFVSQRDVNRDGDVDDHWNEHFPAGTMAVMPAPRGSGADLILTLPSPAGYYTSADNAATDLGLRNEDANAADLELRERFTAHPQPIRRSTEIPADRYLRYTVTDSGGAAVPTADLRVRYEYDPPGDWQNYELKARVAGQGSIPLVVPPGGRLRIEMFADTFVSNEFVIDAQTADSNSLRSGNQGNAPFRIPATAAEIAQAIANTPDPGTPTGTPPGPNPPNPPNPPGPAPGPGIGMPALIGIGLLLLGLILLFVILRRRP